MCFQRAENTERLCDPLENLVVSRMNADQKEICEILLQTKGNRQYVKNVFGTNWLPYVTSYYGYRVHPISGEKNYHTGVDIGMPEGTEILAGHDGTVTLAGNAGGYGLCVAIEGEAYEGHTLTTKYGHCSQILVSAGQEVKAGDVIAKVGNTGNSTGAHLHLEVLVDGQYLNPLYFADTGDTSERHLPEVGSGGTGNYFDYDIPPEALADEQFAAMMAEAEKYLGYPYVWGGASPSTSFDCSGYVSWVINNCGVGWNFGRLTADGLLGVCTPVSSADAKPGDLIFFQGTYNTSGASHVGIYVGNGMMIHCGDPISYANINTSYWQQHFYTFGRLPEQIGGNKLNPKIEKLEKEIEKTKTKIAEMQAKLHKLEEQKTELENTDYVAVARSFKLTPQQLADFLKSQQAAPSETILPQEKEDVHEA